MFSDKPGVKFDFNELQRRVDRDEEVDTFDFCHLITLMDPVT